MIRVLKPLFGVTLALMITLTGQHMAVARGDMAATGQMVICTGTGTKTIYVDAEGVPTTTPHACPDCIIALALCSVRSIYGPAQYVSPSDLHLLQVIFGVSCAISVGFLSRAPPSMA